MDPFATFGVPATFDLELAEIERRYRDLQRTLHPDRFVSAPSSERQAALQKAVCVNEAYRTLRDPLSRARALLALRGHVVASDEKADPMFLMEIMERREALSDARAKRDLDSVRKLATEVREDEARAHRRLAELFSHGTGSEIAGELSKMQYFRRFLSEIESIEEEATAS
jgi:molecular chaperone HscB